METMNAQPASPHHDQRLHDGHQHDATVGEAHAPAPASAPAHEENPIPNDLPTVRTPVVTAVLIAFTVLLAALFAVGYVPNHQRRQEADAVAAERQDLIPRVDVIQPRRPSTAGDLVLFADARAMQETSIYPRANGYLKRLEVDIGDRVKAGQLLAEIDTPEVDAQLNEARAALEQSKANVTKAQADYEFAGTTFQRFQSLDKTQAVTPQDLDQRRSAFNQASAALAAAKANVGASEAAVQRLTETQSFSRVTAPFAGVIAARNYDVGALLSPTNTGAGRELFRIAQTDTLRAFVNVPQSYVTSIRPGQPASLEVRNFPGRQFMGKVTRSAGALDPATRTLRMQVDIPNPGNLLLAGMYGQVQFHLSQEKPNLLVPSSAMLFRSDGTQLAVVEAGKVHFRKIAIGRDLGTEMEITDGLQGGEQIVTNPGPKLAEGTDVEVVASPKLIPAASPRPKQSQAAAR
jgi:RND family efflux transporter MFP subunit